MKKAVQKREVNSHYCIVFGMYAALMNIPMYEALLGFYYTSVAGMITNAVSWFRWDNWTDRIFYSRCIPSWKKPPTKP
jgi:urease accessory protein UreF